MAVREIVKVLGGMEDLATGVGKEDQLRAGTTVQVGKIDVPYALESETEIADLDIAKYTYARLGNEEYRYDEAATEGDIKSNVGPGYWLVGGNSLYAHQQAVTQASAGDSQVAHGKVFPKDAILPAVDGNDITGYNIVRLIGGPFTSLSHFELIAKDGSGSIPSGVISAISLLPPYSCTVGSDDFWLRHTKYDKLDVRAYGADPTKSEDSTIIFTSLLTTFDWLTAIGNYRIDGSITLTQEKIIWLGFKSSIEKLKENTADTLPILRLNGNQVGVTGQGESSRVIQTTSGGYDAMTDLTKTGIINVGPTDTTQNVDINFWQISNLSIWGDLEWFNNDQSARPGLVETCSQGFGGTGSTYNGMCDKLWFRQLSTGHLKTSVCNGSVYSQFNFYRMTRSCINIDAINRTGDPGSTNYACTENMWQGFFVHKSAGVDVIKTAGRARGNTFIGNAEPGSERNGRDTHFYNFNYDSWRNTVIGYGNTGNAPIDDATSMKNPNGGNFALDNTNLRQGSPSTFSNFPTSIETADIEILTSKINVDSGSTVRKPFIKSLSGNVPTNVIKVTFTANAQQFMVKLDIANTGSTTSASRSSQYMISGNTGTSGTVNPNVDLIGGDDITVTTDVSNPYELIIGWTPGSSSFNTAQGDLLVTSAGSGTLSVEIL